MLFVGQKKAIGHNAHHYIMTLKKLKSSVHLNLDMEEEERAKK